MLRCILFLIKLSVVVACTCTNSDISAEENLQSNLSMWSKDNRSENACLCCPSIQTKYPTIVKKDGQEFCRVSRKSPTTSNSKHECRLQPKNMVRVMLKEQPLYGKNTTWTCGTYYEQSKPFSFFWQGSLDNDHLTTVGLTTVGRNLTTEAVHSLTTKVQIVGANIIPFFFAVLLLVLPVFCYIIKHHKKLLLDSETSPVDPPQVEYEATRNDQGHGGQLTVDGGQCQDDTTIVSVVDLTGYTTLGITDAILNRPTAFTMRDRFFLHNISRQLQIIINRIYEMKLRPDVEAVKGKAIEKGNSDDDETEYGASGQSTRLKTLVGAFTDQPSGPGIARVLENSVYAFAADNGPRKIEIKSRKRLPSPRFDETSPNFYFDIAEHAMRTPINDDWGNLVPIQVASTSADVSPQIVR